MIDLKAFATENIQRLNEPGNERVYHNLVEADHAIVPLLIEAFRSTAVVSVRADLVEIVWQHRLPESVEFLAEALDDPAQEVWSNALDGLVTLGGQTAIQVLESARQRAGGDHIRVEWIGEAIQHIKEQHA